MAISNTENENQILSGLRKAAIAIVALGDEVATEVFRLLTEDEVRKLSREVSTLKTVTPDQAEKTLQDFHELSMAHEYLVSGGIDYTKRILNAAFGTDRARRIIDRLVKSMGDEISNFNSLQRADPQQVAKLIQGEHPQTIALVLSHLNSGSAAGMLMALPTEIRVDVAARMAHLDQISPEIVGRIAALLEQKV